MILIALLLLAGLLLSILIHLKYKEKEKEKLSILMSRIKEEERKRLSIEEEYRKKGMGLSQGGKGIGAGGASTMGAGTIERLSEEVKALRRENDFEKKKRSDVEKELELAHAKIKEIQVKLSSSEHAKDESLSDIKEGIKSVDASLTGVEDRMDDVIEAEVISESAGTEAKVEEGESKVVVGGGEGEVAVEGEEKAKEVEGEVEKIGSEETGIKENKLEAEGFMKKEESVEGAGKKEEIGADTVKKEELEMEAGSKEAGEFEESLNLNEPIGESRVKEGEVISDVNNLESADVESLKKEEPVDITKKHAEEAEFIKKEVEQKNKKTSEGGATGNIEEFGQKIEDVIKQGEGTGEKVEELGKEAKVEEVKEEVQEGKEGEKKEDMEGIEEIEEEKEGESEEEEEEEKEEEEESAGGKKSGGSESGSISFEDFNEAEEDKVGEKKELTEKGKKGGEVSEAKEGSETGKENIEMGEIGGDKPKNEASLANQENVTNVTIKDETDMENYLNSDAGHKENKSGKMEKLGTNFDEGEEDYIVKTGKKVGEKEKVVKTTEEQPKKKTTEYDNEELQKIVNESMGKTGVLTKGLEGAGAKAETKTDEIPGIEDVEKERESVDAGKKVQDDEKLDIKSRIEELKKAVQGDKG